MVSQAFYLCLQIFYKELMPALYFFKKNVGYLFFLINQLVNFLSQIIFFLPSLLAFQSLFQPSPHPLLLVSVQKRHIHIYQSVIAYQVAATLETFTPFKTGQGKPVG